ncbi:sensor histidine kinase [Halorientalis salina]|uniref:sensor histidine kinase n=1 Tax=Halorientalis salina TaxID=2932266 RepID=UPI0010ACD87E|nr:PAS domain S-box protein [Halorientalis salina]
MTESLHVVIVDDDAEFSETVTRRLEREGEQFSVSRERRACDALDTLRTESVACIVSDYELASTDGIAFLDDVRDYDSNLPFILFTGDGSESLASEALSHGVTDYVQKSGAGEVGTVLANRIRNAVESHRTRQTLVRERERYRTFLEQSTDLMVVVDGSGTFTYVSQSWQRLMGYEPSELVGRNAFESMHPEDVSEVWTVFKGAVRNPDETRTAEFRFEDADGSWRWLEAIGNNQLSNPRIEGFIVNIRDITERKERERELREQNDRLEQFASVVSHDLRNPMNIISGRLELARETGDDCHFEAAEAALCRMSEMVDEILDLAREGLIIEETEPVELEPLLERCREVVDSDDLTLEVATATTIHGDRNSLRRVFENLLRNAVEHAGPEVTVTVGTLDDESGFYVEDDGPGIPQGKRTEILETGFTTANDGTGLGLAIVENIVDAHGWSVTVTDATDGGARFEVTGVEAAPRACEREFPDRDATP